MLTIILAKIAEVPKLDPSPVEVEGKISDTSTVWSRTGAYQLLLWFFS